VGRCTETNKEWFTYVVSDFPKRLTDFHGNEVDSDTIVLSFSLADDKTSWWCQVLALAHLGGFN
jgi:hypothetical protein